ncbi:MAG: hypothetical protein U0791_14665 [Gemmataceae bacterium]
MPNDAEGTGRVSNSSPDPFANLSRFAKLSEALDELAAEFWAKRKPLYNALTSVPSEDPERWHEAGKQLRNAGLAAFPKEMADSSPVDEVPPPEQVARWTAWTLLSAAAMEDRPRVSELLANVAKLPEVKESLAEVIYRVQEDCLAKWRIQTSPPYIARTKELLNGYGISLEAAMEWMQTGRTGLAAGTHSALRDWFRSIELCEPIAMIQSEIPDDASLLAYLDDIDRKFLERLRLELPTLSELEEMLNGYHRLLATLCPDKHGDVLTAFQAWEFARNAKYQLEQIDAMLRRRLRINSPAGLQIRSAAKMLATAGWWASILLPLAKSLLKDCTAFATAAARHRGIIGAGAALTDDAIRELIFAVRPNDESVLPAAALSAAAPPPPPAGKRESEGGKPPGNVATPDWIRQHFRQQQYKLLAALFGAGDVKAEALCKILDYTNSTTASENLHRRVTQTNKGLCEKAQLIGGTWEISSRKRDQCLFYYLHQSN